MHVLMCKYLVTKSPTSLSFWVTIPTRMPDSSQYMSQFHPRKIYNLPINEFRVENCRFSSKKSFSRESWGRWNSLNLVNVESFWISLLFSIRGGTHYGVVVKTKSVNFWEKKYFGATRWFNTTRLDNGRRSFARVCIQRISHIFCDGYVFKTSKCQWIDKSCNKKEAIKN